MKLSIAIFLFLIYKVDSESNLTCCYSGCLEGDLQSCTCTVRSPLKITLKDYQKIQVINDRHLLNDKVKFVVMNEPKLIVKYFPRDLKIFFNNLENILLEKMELTEISKDDLLEHGEDLMKLSIQHSKIEDLSSDLFIYNENLQKVSFAYNKIKKIPTDLFKPVRNIKSIDLSYNRIKNLPLGLFVHNKNLFRLNFNNNRIIQIEIGAFHGPLRLSHLSIKNNMCTFEDSNASGAQEISALIDILQESSVDDDNSHDDC